MRVLLVGSYELGHQPLSVAGPAAALREAGHQVVAIDLAVDGWDPHLAEQVDAAAFSVPMHTAARLALQVIRSLREDRPRLPIALYGLYAGMAADDATALGADVLPGGGSSEVLAWVATGLPAGLDWSRRDRSADLVPDRSVLPALHRYATLESGDGCRPAGSTAASTGCRHRCRHCPVPVVWDGRIRIAPEAVVLADVDQQIEAGMRHLSFADPDFLNAPAHARRIAAAVHERHPDLTWDCTVKVEHVLAHRQLWAELAEAGLLFVVSAVETLDDAVLTRLDKGHTGADATKAVTILRDAGIELRPSLLPFTPWTTLDSLAQLLRWVADLDLIGNVDPVQFTVRLLVPPGSLLLDQPDLAVHLDAYDAAALAWTWRHPDPSVDALQRSLAALVEARVEAGLRPAEVFPEIWDTVNAAGGRLGPPPAVPSTAGGRPRLSESWFCCSEPTALQLKAAGRP